MKGVFSVEKKEYLNEENYQNGKKKLIRIALIILIVGLLLGGSIIVIGISKQARVYSEHSDEHIVDLSGLLEVERQNIIATRTVLEAKIEPIEKQIKDLQREPFTGFDDAYYARQDRIEELEKSIAEDKKTISVINEVLANANHACSFDGKTNTITSEYCALNSELNDAGSNFDKDFDSFNSIPFYIIGAFIIIASGMISGSIYMIAKRREILAFSAQQVMPVAQEGIEKMAPTIGKAGASIAKEMAPAYGNIAKEISKGIKEGMKGEEK